MYIVTKEENETAMDCNISAGRVHALETYTYFFGGTFEQNQIELENLSTKEILEKIREYRRSTKGKDALPEELNDGVGYISEKRLEAVKVYTEVFGGTVEENIRILRGTTSKEIYEMVKKEKGDE